MTRRALRAAGLGALLLAQAACAPAHFPARQYPAAAAPSPGDWLAYLNAYRAAAGLPPVSENPAWSAGDRKHAAYIVKNDAIQHTEDPRNRWYTPEGRTAAGQSNLAVSYDRDRTDRWAIDSWMQSPFHAIGLLDPRLTRVGFGSYRETDRELRMGAALNVVAGIDHTRIPVYPVFWPGNGATVPLRQHRGEEPSPLSSCPGYTAPSGLPIIVQVGPGSVTPRVSATSLTQDGRALEHCVIDETTYSNPDRAQQKIGRSILGARDAIVLIPRRPLESGATYKAAVTVNGRTHRWSFKIHSSAQAPEDD